MVPPIAPTARRPRHPRFTQQRTLTLALVLAASAGVAAQDRTELREDVSANLTHAPESNRALGPAVHGAERFAEQMLADPAVEGHEVSLPDGEERSAATPQRLTLPDGEGSAQGMGERFRAVLSSGAGGYSVPIVLPPGRAGHQPSITLGYSTSSGNGPLGFGWSLGVSSVARMGDRGVPRYVDRPRWQALEDRLALDGAELVPVDPTTLPETYRGGAPPAELADYQAYRTRIEGGFRRVYRSPDWRHWVVQSADGSRLDYGVVTDGPTPRDTGALVRSGARVHTWKLVRSADANGNVVHFTYESHGGLAYVRSVHYDSPSDCARASVAETRACAAPLSTWGRRVEFHYEAREDVRVSRARGFSTTLARRLRRIDVVSVAGGEDDVVRRYPLRYAPGHHSLLAEIWMEGREVDGVRPRLPATRFVYSGLGSLNPITHHSPSSPPVGVREATTDLFDVNGDGLTDVIRTLDGRIDVHFNGFPEGRPGMAGAFSPATPTALPLGHRGAVSLADRDVRPMDADGDGRSDLVRWARYSERRGRYTPQRERVRTSPTSERWQWAYAEAHPLDDPDLDLGSPDLRAVDLDADGFVDWLETAGDHHRVWFNLGHVAGGDGRFGHAAEGARGWEAVDEPETHCAAHAGGERVRFSEGARLADLDGDGLQDLVWMDLGRIVYFPGNGDGTFGDGCEDGFATGGVEMAAVPPRVRADRPGLSFADVDHDGTADLLEIRDATIEVWFNRGGDFFAAGERIDAPFALGADVRLVDLDASGTIDVLYAASGDWRWVDLLGGVRPRLLTRIELPTGGEARIEYESSAIDYLEDLAADVREGSEACAGGCGREGNSPALPTVVRATEVCDRLDVLGPAGWCGRTEYRYHAPRFDGTERAFRGFGRAEEIAVGDASHPTAITETRFHRGARPASLEGNRLAANPFDAIAATPWLVETRDDEGTTLSTSFTQIALRTIAHGLDGRPIAFAYPFESGTLAYETEPFTALDDHLDAVAVRVEGTGGAEARTHATETIPIRGAGAVRTRETTETVTDLGQVVRQTQHGQVTLADAGPIDPTIHSQTVHARLEDPTGWLHATVSQFVEDGSGARFGETLQTYDERGRVIRTTTLVHAPVALEFDGYDHALGFVQRDEAQVSSTTYDDFGNPLVMCAGGDLAAGLDDCGRLSVLVWDTDYAALPVLERLYTGSATFLDVVATWDAGLGVPRAYTDATGATTETRYDALGRASGLVLPPVEGCPAGVASSETTYDVPDDSRARPMTVVTTRTSTNCHGDDAIVSRRYVDGLGRGRAMLTNGDALHPWVQSGLTALDARGAATGAFQGGFLDDPDPTIEQALTPVTRVGAWTERDAFSRVRRTVNVVDTAVTEAHYRPLEVTTCDANDDGFRDFVDGLVVDDIDGPVFAGTCETERSDGHGRAVESVQRYRSGPGAAMQFFVLRKQFRADGALLRLERAEVASDAPGAPVVLDRQVAREFVFDSIGRRLATVDRDTDRPGATPTEGRWRYLYDDLGQLLAVRDPRGCGQNFFYDRVGRLRAEQYVGCAESAPSPVAPMPLEGEAWADGAVPAGTPVDTQHWYDARPAWAGWDGLPPSASELGRHVATADRAQRSQSGHDLRGQVVWGARQVRQVGDAPALDTRPDGTVERLDGAPQAEAWWPAQPFLATTVHDHAGRVVKTTLPTDPFEGASVGGELEYDARGLPALARVLVDDLPLVDVLSSAQYDFDGALLRGTYGDDRFETVTERDARRRPLRATTTRLVPVVGGLLPEVAQLVDTRYVFDDADNLVETRDLRDPESWPAGHRPRSTRARHDSLYRVVGVEHRFGPDPADVLDAPQDWRDERARQRPVDPMSTVPAPRLGGDAAGRAHTFAYAYDFLANMTEWTGDDPSAGFYERSLGTLVNGAQGRPSALASAHDLGGDDPANRGGWLDVAYGDGGNVLAYEVHARCADAGGVCAADDLARCACAEAQRYEYDWDELDRLDEARRYDGGAGAGWTLAARQRYRYDGQNRRVVKQTLPVAAGTDERIALDVVAGDFVLRGVRREAGVYTSGEGADRAEAQYLLAGARIVWQEPPPESGELPRHRVTMALTDLVQSTTAVVDLLEGELVQVGTFHPNGARETLLVADDPVSPEPAGFTTKEADEEVGLVYFGERYLIPRLGRWATPDPAEIHALAGGEVLNSYHYVGGNVLQTRDPIGLNPAHGALAQQWADAIKKASGLRDTIAVGIQADGTVIIGRSGSGYSALRDAVQKTLPNQRVIYASSPGSRLGIAGTHAERAVVIAHDNLRGASSGKITIATDVLHPPCTAQCAPYLQGRSDVTFHNQRTPAEMLRARNHEAGRRWRLTTNPRVTGIYLENGKEEAKLLRHTRRRAVPRIQNPPPTASGAGRVLGVAGGVLVLHDVVNAPEGQRLATAGRGLYAMTPIGMFHNSMEALADSIVDAATGHMDTGGASFEHDPPEPNENADTAEEMMSHMLDNGAM